MPNPWRNYLQNFRDNLPLGVTYRSDIARYIFNDRRFVWPWDVVQYRQYLIKLGFQDDLSQVIELLFPNDEPGFLFTADPATCFTDTAGTTQAGPGDPVALWLDQSGNGNHATQPTTANRPILGRKPKGGRRNLLERTDDPTQWVFRGERFSASGQDGDGGFLLTGIGDHDNDLTRFSANYPAAIELPENQTIVRSVEVSKTEGTADTVFLGSTASNRSVFVRISDGAIVSIGSEVSAQVTDTGDGYWRIETWAPTGSAVHHTARFGWGIYTSGTVFDETDNYTVKVRKPSWALVVEENFTDSVPYQRVGNNFDVTEAGKPDRHYLFFGGSADPRWMQTPVITPGTDKVQVFAGVKINTDDTVIITENSTDASAGEGKFSLFKSSQRVRFRSRGTTSRDAIGPIISLPFSGVYTGIGDISEPLSRVRQNGVVGIDQTSSQGAVNYTTSPIFIGARGGVSNFLNGEISALTTRFGPNLDTNQIEQVEKFTASKVAEDTI